MNDIALGNFASTIFINYLLVTIIIVLTLLMIQQQSKLRRVIGQRNKSDKDRLMNNLGLSINAEKLFRWSYNIIDRQSRVTDSLGNVHLYGDSSIKVIAAKDREKLQTYMDELITGTNSESIIDVWAHSEDLDEERLYRLIGTVERDSCGVPTHIHGVWKDITEEYTLQKELEEFRKNTTVALEIGNLATWSYVCQEAVFYMLDGGHKGVYSNQGISRDFFLINYIHPDDKADLVKKLDSVERGLLDKVTHTFRFKIANQWRWILTSVMPIKEDGVITSLLGIRRDVTAEVEYRQTLVNRIREVKEYSEELFGILDNLPIPIGLKNMVTDEYTFVNKLAKIEYGLTMDTVSPYKIVGSTLGKEFVQKKKSGIYEAEELLELVDGRIVETMVRSTLVEYKKTKHALISRIDLTESNKAKRDSKAMSKYMLMMKGYTWFIDTRTNRAIFEHNMDLEQDISKFTKATQMLDVVHEDDRAKCADYIQWLVAGDLEGNRDAHFRLDIEKKGVYEWWEALASAEIINENGEEYRLLSGIVINVHSRKVAELKLQELNYQKELIFNNMSSILVYITNDFEVQWSNSHQILGDEWGSIYKQGTKCYHSFGLENPCPNCPALQAMRSGEVVCLEFNRMPDAKVYESTATVIKGENGMDGVVLKLDNITELKQVITELESTNQFMSLLVEELPTPFFVKDVNDDFKYIYASTIFCDRIANKPREAIIGLTDYEVFDDLDAANKFRNDDLHVINNSGGKVINVGEEHVVNNSGESIVETRKLHLKLPNNRSYLIGQASDVTEIRKINEQLMIAKEKAEEAGKLKSAFLANMSHEIRTPLNAIVGFSELLKYAENRSEREEYIKIIDTNNELLLQLIGDVLDLSRIESGSVDLSPEYFDFTAFFQETYTTLKPRCEKIGVELQKKTPLGRCMVTLDKHRCLQVITNYLTNAVKFTEEGYIKMGYDYRDKGLLIYVEDSGVGLSKEKQERLFQRFEKMNDFAQGTGLGLSICKAITEAMGGNVWAESEEGVGSTFFAWLPCEATISCN